MREEIVKFENNISIRILGAEVPPIDPAIPFKQRTKLISDLHLHNEYEFLRINRGILRCVTLGGEFYLEEGDIMFINKYVPHSTFTENNHTHDTLIQFRVPSDNDAIVHYISRFANICDTSAFLFKKNARESLEIQNHINAIINEYTEQKPFWNDYIYNHMFMLVTALRRQGIISGTVQNKIDDINKIRPVLEYINSNYSDELSTYDLSRIMNFNETYFCRLFKRIIGTSAINYINFVRVCKAEKLLKKNMSLLEIANQTGFSSLSYFNRVFKKYNHYSPSEYRKIINARSFDLSSQNK